MTRSEQETWLETIAEQLQPALERCWRTRRGNLGVEVLQARLVLKPRHRDAGDAALAPGSDPPTAWVEASWYSGPEGLPVRQRRSESMQPEVAEKQRGHSS